MSKRKYEVVRPWHGVALGAIVELGEPVHPSLKSHVRPLKGDVARLVAATPAPVQQDPVQTDDPADTSESQKDPEIVLVRNKANVAKRLKELGINFDGKASLEELAAMLPEGDSLKA